MIAPVSQVALCLGFLVEHLSCDAHCFQQSCQNNFLCWEGVRRAFTCREAGARIHPRGNICFVYTTEKSHSWKKWLTRYSRTNGELSFPQRQEKANDISYISVNVICHLVVKSSFPSVLTVQVQESSWSLQQKPWMASHWCQWELWTGAPH